MTHSLDQFVAYLKAEKARKRWRLIAILALIAVIVTLYPKEDALRRTHPYVAHINLHGMIEEDLDAEAALYDLLLDDHAKALTVHIDSPGGTMVGGLLYYKAFERIKSAGKPVVVIMGTTAASAGYLAALPANYIVANEATTTGSIGVMIPLVDVHKMVNNWGIESNFITSGNLKAAGLPIEKMTPNERKYLQDTVNGLRDIFFRYVTQNRTLSPEVLAQISDGRAVVGQKALEMGLIDATGGRVEAWLWLEKNAKIGQDMPVIDITPKKDLDIWQEFVYQGRSWLSTLAGIKQFPPM